MLKGSPVDKHFESSVNFNIHPENIPEYAFVFHICLSSAVYKENCLGILLSIRCTFLGVKIYKIHV